MISNTAYALREALAAFDPRELVLVLDAGPNGNVNIVLADGELWATDGGSVSTYLTAEGVPMLDEATGGALCAEHGCGWFSERPGGPWITRRLKDHESPAAAVADVQSAIGAVLMAAGVCRVAAGEDTEGSYMDKLRATAAHKIGDPDGR